MKYTRFTEAAAPLDPATVALQDPPPPVPPTPEPEEPAAAGEPDAVEPFAFAAAESAASAGEGWSTPSAIATLTWGGFGSLSNIAVSPSGRLFVAWTGPQGAVYYAWSDGGVWSPLVEVRRGVYSATLGPSAIAVDSSERVHLVWEEQAASGAVSLAYYRACQNDVCGPASPLTPATPQVGCSLYPLATPPASKWPAVAVDTGGHVLAVWAQYEPGGVYLPYAYWPASDPLPGERSGCAPASQYLKPALAADESGAIHMASVVYTPGGTYAYDVLYGAFAGGQWTPITRIVNVGYNNGYGAPALATAGGRVHLATCAKVDASRQGPAYLVKEGGGPWSARELIPNGTRSCSGALAAAVDGQERVWVSWVKSGLSSNDIAVGARDGEWSTVDRAVACFCNNPALSADGGGGLHLMWVNNSGGLGRPSYVSYSTNAASLPPTPTPTATATVEAPQHSLSKYVGWTHITKQADGTTLGEFRPDDFREMGCNQALGQAMSLPPITDQLIVLAFGYPKVEDGIYGAVIYNAATTNSMNESWNRFISNDNIEEAAKKYIRGYEYCRANTDASVTLVLGLNNSAGDVTRDHGVEWAKMIDRIYTWMSSHDCKLVDGVSTICDSRTYVSIAGGMDAESFENSDTHEPAVTAGPVKAWAKGFGDASVARRNYYNFGTCDSCTIDTWNGFVPPTVHANTTWTYEDYWVLSYENNARPLPEIYVSGHARQWEWLRQYGLNKHQRLMVFAGTMTQSGACFQTGGCGTTNSPEQGWQDLFDAMAPPVVKLRWSTDIFFMNNPQD